MLRIRDAAFMRVLGRPARSAMTWRASLSSKRLQTGAAACLIVALALPLLVHAKPALLGPDESLYLSEAVNIAEGKGLTYTSGENINHRPPLFPALLAADFKVLGTSLDNAHWLTKLFAVVAAVLLFFVGRELFGFWAGLAGAVLVVASSYLSSVATTLYLDAAETAFLLLSILLLLRALRRPTAWAFAWSGAALGVAFLVKETALLWLPLPFVAWLVWREHRTKEVGLGAVAFAASFALLVGWWWVWVFITTREVFLFHQLGRSETLLAAAFGVVVVGCLGALWFGVRSHRLRSRLARVTAGPHVRRLEATLPVLGILVLAAWCLLFLMGIQGARATLTQDYWRTIPDYVRDRVASNVDPFYALLVSWLIVAWRAVRGNRADGMLLLVLLLFSPVLVSVANSNLQVRQLLPGIYLSYLAFGSVLGLLLTETRSLATERAPSVRALAYGMAAGLVLVGGTFIFTQQRSFLDANADIDSERVATDNWSNPLVENTARWIEENVPAGSHIMSSHLFHSHLYFLTRGRYPIYQLPTVRVRIDLAAARPLERVGTLFRFEDHLLGPPPSEDRWLYMEWVPVHNYWVALSETDLLDDLRERDVQYLVLTGDDRVYSSLVYREYFAEHPAFALEHSERSPTGAVQLLVFRVDQSKLVPMNDHLTMGDDAFIKLFWGLAFSRKEGDPEPGEVIRRISPAPVQIEARDERAAEAEAIVAQIYGE